MEIWSEIVVGTVAALLSGLFLFWIGEIVGRRRERESAAVRFDVAAHPFDLTVDRFHAIRAQVRVANVGGAPVQLRRVSLHLGDAGLGRCFFARCKPTDGQTMDATLNVFHERCFTATIYGQDWMAGPGIDIPNPFVPKLVVEYAGGKCEYPLPTGDFETSLFELLVDVDRHGVGEHRSAA